MPTRTEPTVSGKVEDCSHPCTRSRPGEGRPPRRRQRREVGLYGRPITSPGVDSLLARKNAHTSPNWSRRYKNHAAKLSSGDVYQVAEVVRNLSLRQVDSHLSAGEMIMLSNARRVLVSELSIALNVSDEETKPAGASTSLWPSAGS